MVDFEEDLQNEEAAVEQPKTLYSRRNHLVDQELGVIDRGKSMV